VSESTVRRVLAAHGLRVRWPRRAAGRSAGRSPNGLHMSAIRSGSTTRPGSRAAAAPTW
jgi:hypothetical protein